MSDQENIPENAPVSQETEAKKKIWRTVSVLMENFDSDKNQHLDAQEIKPLLQGVLTGLEKEYNDDILNKYYKDETYCADEGLGLDKKGLFKMLCDINELGVPDEDFFTTSVVPQPKPWTPEIIEGQICFSEELMPETFKWPEAGVAESWPYDKQIKLQKILYARLTGEHEVPLVGIQLLFTNGIKSPLCGVDDLEMVGIAEKVEIIACDTDFSVHNIGKVGMLVSEKDGKYLAMKVWDTAGELINQTTFWTAGIKEKLHWAIRDIPAGEEIIGLYAHTEEEMKITSLGFRTWKPNPNASPVPKDEIVGKMFRKTAMWGYTDTPTDVASDPDYNDLWHCRFTQWPLECDYYEMYVKELDKLKIASFQGWAKDGEEFAVQGFSTTLTNGMCDSGDFYNGDKIGVNLVAGSQVDIAEMKQANVEIKEQDKIGRVRVYEKDRNMPGQHVIHGVEFIDKDGKVIGRVKSKGGPRAGCVRDIYIDKREKIVGTYQWKDQGGLRAIGFICMHTGFGYQVDEPELDEANSIPVEDLRKLKIDQNSAIVRAQHANFENNCTYGSNHNLIWQNLPDDSDAWNLWHCDKNESWVEVDFQQKEHVVCMVGFEAAKDDNNPTKAGVSAWDEEAQTWKDLCTEELKYNDGEARIKIQACSASAMRFQFSREAEDKDAPERLALNKINFYGPAAPTAEGRRTFKADDIVLSVEKSQTGPFQDCPLEITDLQNNISDVLNDNNHVNLDGSEQLHGVCKEIADSIFRAWAVKSPDYVKGNSHPAIIASMHQAEPPSANSGDHCHKYNKTKGKGDEKWSAFEFKVDDWWVVIKFVVAWGKHAERACHTHFNDFQAAAECHGINQSDKLRSESKKEDKDCAIF